MIELEWNVFLYDGCRSKAEPRKFNIFDNINFRERVEELLATPELTREEIEEEVRAAARWQFWSRCQYEFILLSWPTGEKETGYKMDVFEQLEMNWDRFIDYIWIYYCFRDYIEEDEE